MAVPPELEHSEFVALCAQYLDLKFDLVQDQPEHEQHHFSSPCSNDTDQDSTGHSKQSASTTRTTPLRPSPHLVEEPDLSSVPSFLLHVQYSDLSQASKDFLRCLADHIWGISSLLGSEYHLHLGAVSALVNHANTISAQVKRSSAQVQDQISNIAYIKTLAPFEVHATPIDLWCNYRQMIQLIVKHTALPCRTELVLVEHLAHIFDAHVYHPFLLGTHLRQQPRSVENAVNLAYDSIMALLHKYKLWCNAMKDIKQNHIQPVLHCIQNSPEILQSIKDFEARQDAVKAVMRSDNAPGMQPLEPWAKLRLEQATRSKHIPPKTKDKFRREQTI